ncbi:MAG: cytochrome c oxidase subunit [Thermoleophilaceae bacterium]|jgi:cytochrome c oxidase subunit 2|nr:cytochrome c oxidase subunit [Thermoleophilaceae bacterium]
MRRTKHPFIWVVILSAIAIALGIALALAIDWFPEAASTAAGPIDTLYDVLLIVSVPIFVLVMAVVIYSVYRFRARPGDKGDGAPIHGNTLLEVVWVTIPTLIVAGLAVYGYMVLQDIERVSPGAMEVDVTGQQYTWSFNYPDGPGGQPVKSGELYLPVGKQVNFEIKALDVLHSFWVPEFRMKSDAVPGITTHYPITPTREGDFQVVCAELCGIGHSTMRQPVHVVSQADFDTWLEQQSQGGAAAGADTGAEQTDAGASVFDGNGCGGCHEFKTAGSTGSVGPSLDDLASAADQAGKDPETFVEESITDPDAYVAKGYPKGTMPANFGDTLTPEEITALTTYLLGSGTEKGKAQ